MNPTEPLWSGENLLDAQAAEWLAQREMGFFPPSRRRSFFAGAWPIRAMPTRVSPHSCPLLPTTPSRFVAPLWLAAVCCLAVWCQLLPAAQFAATVASQCRPARHPSRSSSFRAERQTAVYLIDVVRDVLRRMLADTPLGMAEDAGAGALAVQRGPADANFTRVAPLRTDAARPGPNASEDEALTLSPFVISSEKGHGNSASSTLAGSRIRSPLKDVAAQLSVFTPELMNDLGLTNLEEVYLYSTNVEGDLE